MAKYPLYILTACLLVATLTGCSHKPRTRIGSVPHPGLFTLYATADPADLGSHSYAGPSFDETGRGIIYSEHGGFIDVAHVRITADWAHFYYQSVYEAIQAEQTGLNLPMNKSSRLLVTLNYPDHWQDLDEQQKDQVSHMLALRIGQELAWILGAWHEIATWFGYSSLVIASEKGSSFTYEDIFSHLVGLWVFEEAMSNQDVEFDEAVTLALERNLELLGAVPIEQTEVAVKRVEGRWWDNRGAIRRYLELSLDGSPQRPWLVPQKRGEPGRFGEPFDVPRLGTIRGRDYSGFYQVKIEPNIMEGPQILQAAETDEPTVEPFENFPRIVQHIRKEVHDEFGPAAEQP